MSDPTPHTDRRKTVHRDPHAETGGNRRRYGRDNEIQTDPPTTTSEARSSDDGSIGAPLLFRWRRRHIRH